MVYNDDTSKEKKSESAILNLMFQLTDEIETVLHI